MQAPQVAQGVQRFSYVPKFQPPQNFQKPNHVAYTQHKQHLQQTTQNIEFDGKRLRKAVTRKTVDYNTSVIKYLENRIWQRDYRDRRAIQPDGAYYIEMTPPLSMPDNPINAVTTKFVRTSTNKMRCPIFCVAWTPEGRRLVTGASSGEFTLWNGLTFNFETILQLISILPKRADKEVGCMEQAHDSCVWSLAWHPLGHILCSGSNDHSSKFWTRNRPGDKMQDKYNLNTLPKGQEESAEYDDSGTISSIPGMGLEYGLPDHLKPKENSYESEIPMIPGLDFTSEDSFIEKSTIQKKIPFSKPIPKQFQQQWMESKQPLLLAPPTSESERTNGEVTAPSNNSELKPQPPLVPPQEQHFQPNARPPPSQYLEPPPRPPQRSALLGERPKDSPHLPPPPKPELHPGNRPPNNVPYSENHENFSRDLPRNEPGSHDSWRTYSDEPRDSGHPGSENENGAYMQNPDMRHGFESVNNAGPPKRARTERYPHMNEDFIPDNLPPRGGPPPHYPSGDSMRYPPNDLDHRNNHRGPDEMGYMSHKRPWNDGPPPPEDQYPPMMDFDSPDFNPRHSNVYHRGRGPRAPYRGGRSPFRIINRGRGRGGYPS
ncbi:pre-mRNA 3' end processing protein WDR33 like protein [Argiope bruennichi]|uniref:Pre-mRNA 3' end processing protein WDR33 like protein n=1 Tax=Argiope bruennichi TaxID=94029 RepID=A0A8T0E2W6_ARGBR|nr:pre-mRNA 3' end processing protein WDR33 like protein [Argiope bruennichi]